jgi:hypothetical protein
MVVQYVPNSSAKRSPAEAAPKRKPRATDARPPRMRSAVTNGSRLLVDGDGNSAWSRRYRDLVAAHAVDLGGADLLSEAQKSLIRRASTLEVELEAMEARLSKGEAIDLDLFQRAAGNLRRLLESIGLRRVAREVDPIATYLAARAIAVEQSARDPGEGPAGQIAPSPARDLKNPSDTVPE